MLPPLEDLTLPRAPGATLTQLARAWTAGLLREWLSVARTAASLSVGGAYAPVHRALERAAQQRPRELARALQSPVLQALRAPLDAPALRSPEVLEHASLALLCELAAAGLLEEPLTRERPRRGWPALLSLSADLALRPPPACARLRFEAHRVCFGERALELSLSSLPSELAREASAPLWSRTRLALADCNPATQVQQHPERADNAWSLGDAPASEWQRALREAWELVQTFAPELAPELEALLARVVPVGASPERHFSCSYEESVGAIYLSLHPRPVMLAEALVHEFQHNKLHLAMRLDPLLRNPRSALYRSPVRPDPRPLHGVLLAAHAFVPVARMYQRMTEAAHPATRSDDWASRCARIDENNREALALLRAHAQCTPAGEALLEELARLLG